jgi:hypothetical protein
MIESAVARRFWNQFTIATVSGKNPARLEPRAMRRKVRKKAAGVWIWLKRMNPRPKRTMPTRITPRGPNLSVSQPWSGPSMPLSMRDREKAAASIVLLQPNSSRRRTT